MHDLTTNYEISRVEVMMSVWAVVEAVNQHPEFQISYPADHATQRRIAREFQAVSGVQFSNCAGAIDGLLIWISQPSERDAKEAGVSRKKLLCARKHKYGLNMQGTCDRRGRILDMSINYGGASSDLLAFEKSDLYRRLEGGLLADGLVLYGDNAYVNTSYMATPFPGTTRGGRDVYNFFHSQVRHLLLHPYCCSINHHAHNSSFFIQTNDYQLRIRIECAFGQLVHRWAILRSAIPFNTTIQKTVSLVNALVKLHNFCIDTQASTNINESIADSLPSDLNNLMTSEEGFVELEFRSGLDAPIPAQLLGAGEHFLDYPRAIRRRNERRLSQTILPRDLMLRHVINSRRCRPVANRLRNQR